MDSRLLPWDGLPLKRDVGFAARLTWMVVALLAAAASAGLVYGPLGWYDRGAATFPALVGQDVVALIFGGPLLVGSLLLARRGSVRGLLCWMGALFYVAYFWYFYVVGIRFSPLFPVHVALVSLSLYGLLYLVFALDLGDLKQRFDERIPVRLIGGFLIVTALAFTGLWLGLIAVRLWNGADLDTVSRLVIAVDGVVLLPLTLAGGLWLWRREPLGYALATLLLVKLVATFLTLVVTTVFSVRWGQSVDPLQTTLYTIGMFGAAALLVRDLRSVEPGGRS